MDFYAGDLRVAVIRGTHVLCCSEVQTDPDVAKLTRDEYAVMIGEIGRATLALYRLSSVTTPASAATFGIRSGIVAHELIRTNFDAFDRAVSRIADQPLRGLRSVGLHADILKARRVNDQAISAALRGVHVRTATSAETLAAPHLVGALGGRWVSRIVDTRRQDSLDIYENCAVLGFMRWLDATLADLARGLTTTGLKEVTPAVLSVYTDRILRWRARIASLSRRGVFAGLLPNPALHPTSAFRMNPDYALAFSAMSRMRSGLGVGSGAAPSLPLDRTYQLYELWCYVGILAAAAEHFPASRPNVAALLRGIPSPSHLGIALSKGDASEIQLNSRLTLTYQRRISLKPSADGAKTLLIDVIPDITITKRSLSGVCEGLVVLDPKYRVGASLLDGLRDMHVYRDAIISSTGERLTKAAVALAPRPSGLPESDPAFPLDRPAVFSVCPGSDPTVFTRILTAAESALH